MRGHWDIENGLHRALDVVFREDRSRTRAKRAGANPALIRRVAVSLLRRAPGKGAESRSACQWAEVLESLGQGAIRAGFAT